MDLREQLCDFGLSLYQRGLTHGSTGIYLLASQTVI
jgi:hypothetical protein